jgi:hypothetical protein
MVNDFHRFTFGVCRRIRRSVVFRALLCAMHLQQPSLTPRVSVWATASKVNVVNGQDHVFALSHGFPQSRVVRWRFDEISWVFRGAARAVFVRSSFSWSDDWQRQG